MGVAMLPRFCRDGLQYHQLYQPVRLPDHAEHQHGEGDEGDKSHVVGDHHAAKETQQGPSLRDNARILLALRKRKWPILAKDAFGLKSRPR